MKCIIIAKSSPNENIPGYWALLDCGLNLLIIRHPVIPFNPKMLTIVRSPTFDGRIQLGNRRISDAAASLLYTWIDMLETYLDDPDEYILFGESDMMPQYYLSEDVLINSFTRKYDVIRPYVGVTKQLDSHNLIRKDLAYCRWYHNLEFSYINGFRRGVGPNVFRYPFFGTHALILSKTGRKKLIEVFRTYTAHTDVSLCWGVFSGRISMCSAAKQLFVQYDRPSSIPILLYFV